MDTNWNKIILAISSWMKCRKVTPHGQVEAFFLVISVDFQGFEKIEEGEVSAGNERHNNTILW